MKMAISIAQTLYEATELCDQIFVLSVNDS